MNWDGAPLLLPAASPLPLVSEPDASPRDGTGLMWAPLSAFFASADLPSTVSVSPAALDSLLSAASVTGLSGLGGPSVADIFFASFASTPSFAFGSCGSVGAGLACSGLVTASASAQPAECLPSLSGATGAALFRA